MEKLPDHILWQAIQAFHPDKHGVELPFSKRLALENGWSRRYALRAIEEYKKFVFMACTSPTPVTPSEEVDQVWHLHLVYTKSYWDDFCGKVLGRPFHHSPTEGGTQENHKYREQYTRTLEHYATTFGEKPPADIWPAPDQRFSGGLWRWVSLKKYWVVKKFFITG